MTRVDESGHGWDPAQESTVAKASKSTQPTRMGRRRASGHGVVIALQLLVGLALLAMWEITARLELLNPDLFGSPFVIAQRMWSMLGGELLYGHTIYQHLLATGKAFAIGFAIGASAGLVIALVLGRSQTLARIFEPYLLAVYSIPKIAIAPLFVLLFGIELESKIAVVVMGVFFMVFFSTFAGVMAINEDLVNIARIMGARPSQLTRRVVIPAALPATLMGLKMAVPFGVIGAVVGEYIAATQGVGWLIIRSASLFDASGYFSALLFLVLATWGLGQSVSLLQSRLLQWQPQRRQDLLMY